MIVNPDLYHSVQQTHVKPFDIIRSTPKGMNEVAWIIFLIFIIGAAINLGPF